MHQHHTTFSLRKVDYKFGYADDLCQLSLMKAVNEVQCTKSEG